MNRTAIVCTSIAGLCLLGSAAILDAGPLDPPAGPVSPSYKTLTEVEPRIMISTANTPGDGDSQFKISLPGSYYLGGNITGVSGRSGIEIAASGVRLDLNGFTLTGVAGSLNGVTVNVSGPSGIAVVNGTVTGWGQAGVDLSFGANDDCLVESIVALNNGDIGIATRSRAVVRACVASGNTTRGILTLSNSSLSDCVATGNGAGISAGVGSTLDNCVAASNTGDGFLASTTEGGMTFINCSAAKNGGDGFQFTSTGNILTGCSAFRNLGGGFVLNSGSSISNSSAHENGGIGFDLAVACSITSCNARLNDLDGIRASSHGLILNNICILNGQEAAGGAGIHTTGADNRVEGNNCNGNDRGIDADAAGSVYFRNTCSGNTSNWVLVSNNVFGPIVDRTSPGSGSVSGNAAADSSANTNPNANFSY
ncbi:MAG: right-handed parallel beta-helix repeat-containing protein [Phycisphaerales bacterium]|nr:right-handed parallel beta-helix repeat-containing protein [Phycisphaerales bacterium]